ncbi:hypothetical protein MCSF7_02226 [Mycoplasmopsis columbina SF7]|uniref:Uncharacterized protein n=2 Tax=Mycoplasmopsis columbina TaxID=114881 RepID=F9UKN2_9BACT|nr:hypothetical protein MCSF7_02226 [Mycoplasmopsis columbina SF7]
MNDNKVYTFENLLNAYIHIDEKRIENDTRIKHESQRNKRGVGTMEGVKTLQYEKNGHFNISTEVPYGWWFGSRDNVSKAGYVDLRFENSENGLCEYVALSQILLYNELFIKSGIFTDEQFRKYIVESAFSNKLEDTSPLFRYHNNNSPKESLGYKLYELADKNIDLKTGNLYVQATKSFISNPEEEKNESLIQNLEVTTRPENQ